ncbi:ribosome maturation factor RimM [Alteraurantiacibacter aestuarii]|uniref:Ribosome maturation factor RimM n=1 Tax=Alteraurantiacibacter aestuarii TaxID=650004 RepID=A0A844ZJN7_9SPHN|nr:ribosome maturation factor RimM [Alteraurantiacibacter aestuarii]MXO87683.1 16S rRNA processing protein RimM [Alteraurantiacibacter aestuarii]
MARDKPVTLAAISGAHGVTGEVRLKLFGDGLSALKQHTVFNDGALTITNLRDDKKGGAIARLEQVTDRNGAEALRGTTLSVPRSALPPLEEGEYYHMDLIGLAAVSDTGEALGKVVDVQNFGAGDVIEIERPAQDGAKGKRFMVPMNPVAVPQWNDERLVISADYVDE